MRSNHFAPECLFLACALLLAANLEGQTQPFANDIAPKFTFEEHLQQGRATIVGDQYYYLKYNSPTTPPRVKVNAEFSLTGMNRAGFGRGTTFSLSGGNLSFAGALGDDPTYAPGKTKAKVYLEGDLGSKYHLYDSGQIGFIEFDWSDGKVLKVTVQLNDCTPDYYLAAYDFEDINDFMVDAATPSYSEVIERDPDINYFDDLEFIFDDRIFTDRTVYFSGTQLVEFKSNGVFDGDTEEYDTIDISGGISTPEAFIDGPAAGAEVKAPTATVTGRVVVESRIQVDTVLVSVNGGEPVEANVAFPPQANVPNAGFDTWNWTAPGLPLASGSNAIAVQAFDTEGAESKVVTWWLSHPATSSVTVGSVTRDGGGAILATAGGTLDNGFPGTKTFPTGTSLAVRAIPKAGYWFAGWTGTNAGGALPPVAAPVLTIAVQPDTNLIAAFTESPFMALQGAYAGMGVLGAGTAGKPTTLNVTVSNSGFVSGKLGHGGEQLSFRGQVDDSGHLQVSLPRDGQQPVVVALQLDMSGPTDIIAAEVAADGATADLELTRLPADGSGPPAAVAGYYTVVFKRDRTAPYDIYNGPAFPQGHGTAWLRANATGGVSMVGQLADGSRFSFGGVVSSGTGLSALGVPPVLGSLPVMIPLYGQGGWLAGQLLFRDKTGASDADGELHWFRPPGVRDPRNFPAGFDLKVSAVAAKYDPPAAGARIFPNNATAGTVTAGDAAGQYFAKAVQLTATNQVVVPPPDPNRIRFLLAPASGFCNGLFLGPDGRARTFGGVVLRKANAAYGYFPHEGQSGYVELLALPPGP